MLSPARPIDRRPWTAASLSALGAVAGATAAILLWIGRRLALGYDPAWHVFISTQANWTSFLRETARTAHPPLFLLALRVAIDTLGDSLLAYRAISIAAIVLCVWLVGRLTATLTWNAWLGVVAAAAFGLSANAVETGLEVRSYALSLAFMLAAYAAYLDWLNRHPARLPVSTRVVFAAASSAAILTHYAAFFFLGAAVSTPAVLWFSARRWRARLALEARRFPLAAGLMFGLPMATAAAAYALHVSRWSGHRFDHVQAFLWDPAGESSIQFLARNTLNLIRLFVPDAGCGAAATVALSLLLLVSMVWAVGRRAFRSRLGMATVAMLASMGVMNVVAALAGRYPFGGFMRQEIFLFPFALLAVAQGVEAARELAPRAWSSRALWTSAAALSVAASVWLWTSRYQVRTEPLMQPQIDAFRTIFGKPPLVLTDRFNFIPLFAHHRSWTWTPLRGDTDDGTIEVWQVSRPPEQFHVCRSPQWLLDLSKLAAYEDIAACLEGSERVAVFRPQQHFIAPVWDVRQTPRLARDLGARAGLAPTTVRVENNDVYLGFRAYDGARSKAAPSASPRP